MSSGFALFYFVLTKAIMLSGVLNLIHKARQNVYVFVTIKVKLSIKEDFLKQSYLNKNKKFKENHGSVVEKQGFFLIQLFSAEKVMIITRLT